MSPAIKREIRFWLIAAAVAGAYVGVGYLLAPTIPPKPEMNTKAPNTLHDLQRWLQQQDDYRKAVAARQNFFRQWYQWGAGLGIVLLLVFTWWKPPWREPPEEKPAETKEAGRSARRKGRHESRPPTFFESLPISPAAFWWLLGTFSLLITGFVLLALFLHR